MAAGLAKLVTCPSPLALGLNQFLRRALVPLERHPVAARLQIPLPFVQLLCCQFTGWWCNDAGTTYPDHSWIRYPCPRRQLAGRENLNGAVGVRDDHQVDKSTIVHCCTRLSGDRAEPPPSTPMGVPTAGAEPRRTDACISRSDIDSRGVRWVAPRHGKCKIRYGDTGTTQMVSMPGENSTS